MKPKWGKMSCPQMIRHCNRFIKVYTNEFKFKPPISLFSQIFGKLHIFWLKHVIKYNVKKYFKNLKNHHEQRATHFWNHAQKNYSLPFRKFSEHICNEHISIGDKFIDWVVNSFSNNQAPTFYWEKYIRPSLFEEIEL